MHRIGFIEHPESGIQHRSGPGAALLSRCVGLLSAFLRKAHSPLIPLLKGGWEVFAYLA